MPTTFSNPATCKVIPLTEIGFEFAGSLGRVVFTNLEADSSTTIEPITQGNDLAGVTVVARRMTGSAVVMYNDFETMGNVLKAMDTEIPADIDITAKALGGQINGATMTIALTGGPFQVETYQVLWKIESVEHRLRLTLDFQAIYSLDVPLADTAGFGDQLFNQGTGY